MKKRYDRPMSVDEIANVKDEDIDFSDIPELDEQFWKNAVVEKSDRRRPVTLQVRESVVEVFKAENGDYQARMNAVLESYVRSKKAAG